MSDTGDRIRPLRPVERLERDVFAVLSRPTMVADFWTDVTAAESWIAQQRRAGGPPVTLTTMIVKAAAIAALAAPELHRMFGPWRVLEPSHADVGVSVASSTMLSPIVVIPRADTKAIGDIAQEIRAKAHQAREREHAGETLARFAALVPFPLRRALIRWWFRSPQRRRRLAGTIQVSSLERFGLAAGISPVMVDLLLIAGAVERDVHPAPAGGAVARARARFQLHANHQKLNGVTAHKFVRRFRQALGAPDTL